MRRRTLLRLLGSSAVVPWPLEAAAQKEQPTRIFRVTFLEGTPVQLLHDAFERGLREQGFIPGRTIVIDYRAAGGRSERFSALATEIVGSNVDVIVAPSTTAAIAARQATSTIPIVTILAGDPVGSGLAASLAHPGGNVTGTTSQGVDFATKHLELLTEAVPHARRVAVLTIPGNPPNDRGLEEIKAAAAARGLSIVPAGWHADDELDNAFARIIREGAQAIVVFDSPLTFENGQRIIELTAGNHLPAIYQGKPYVKSGGLMSFGPDVEVLARLSAGYVARLLHGARASDLPIGQPTKFELVINLKTAKALGLAVPQSLLARADEVIE